MSVLTSGLGFYRERLNRQNLPYPSIIQESREVTECTTSLLLLPSAPAPTALAQHIVSSVPLPPAPHRWAHRGILQPCFIPVTSRIFWFCFTGSCPKDRAAPWEGREPGLGSGGTAQGWVQDDIPPVAQPHLFPVNSLSMESAPNLLPG